MTRGGRRTLSTFGRLDILVNNAGISHRNQPMLDVAEEEFDRRLRRQREVDLSLRPGRRAAMRRQGGGMILNIGSTAGLRPRPGLTWYNGTKGAVHAITKSMAVELAPERIRVCALAPVAGETPLLATFLGEDTPERRAAFRHYRPARPPVDARRTSPTRRCSSPPTRPTSITGVVLEVDGGRCI